MIYDEVRKNITNECALLDVIIVLEKTHVFLEEKNIGEYYKLKRININS